MNKWLVVTTINPPTAAIEKMSALVQSQGWRCVVVGDKKTPSTWSSPGIDYLSYEEQVRQFGSLATQLPANHYCRKNLGYLFAMREGAEVILETDDDNIPTEQFGTDVNRTVQSSVVGNSQWVNVYRHFSDALIWPRGNPLDTIHDAGEVIGHSNAEAPIQQFLADGDPDVDAIYRLLFKEPLYFRQRDPVSLAKGSWCAFNSQNTLFFRDAFPLLYLPCHVSFRMTDIWRSFVAQAGLWTKGHQLTFRSATVIQERNQHNLMKDFRDEVDGYLNNEAIAVRLNQLVDKHTGSDLFQFAEAAWTELLELGVVQPLELDIFRAWAAQCAKLSRA